MAIERDGSGGFEVSCDGCPEAGIFDSGGDWSELMAMLKEDGWTKRNVRGEWLHYCAECSQEEAA